MESWAALRRHNQGLSPAFDFQNEMKADIRIPIIFITAHGDVPMSVRAR